MTKRNLSNFPNPKLALLEKHYYVYIKLRSSNEILIQTGRKISLNKKDYIRLNFTELLKVPNVVFTIDLRHKILTIHIKKKSYRKGMEKKTRDEDEKSG